MKTIKLLKLILNNFKGIRHMVIEFDEVTNIFGNNGTGKTTVFDAFLWLLFGKDSADKKDFEVKTLGPDNEPYHKLEHEVEAWLNVNGEDVRIKRTLSEKWTKKRGSVIEEMTGHDNVYSWNDVPLKLEEFKSNIDSIVSEGLFKLLTNPYYFHSLKWDVRRRALMAIAGEISDSEILDRLSLKKEEADFTLLIKAFSEKKTIEQFKSELVAKKKKIRVELDTLPARISEAQRSLDLIPVIDEKDTESSIKIIEESISRIDAKLQNSTEADKVAQQERSKKYATIGELRQQITDQEFKIRMALIAGRQSRMEETIKEKGLLSEKNNLYATSNRELQELLLTKKGLVETQSKLREQWHQVNNEQLPAFDENSCTCPTCKRLLDGVNIAEKKEEFTTNFNSNKAKRLKEIQDKGVALSNDIAGYDPKISDLTAKVSTLETEIKVISEHINNLTIQDARLNAQEDQTIGSQIDEDLNIKQVLASISAIENELNEAPEVDTEKEKLKDRKQELQSELSTIREKLGQSKNRTALTQRVVELTESENNQSQQIADLERSEYAIELFVRAKMDTLAERVNGRFQLVKFKMFEDQINGGTSETCETLINGVPYPDANTASKINAGIDIINTLADHYGVTAPIFIDNAESIVETLPTRSQFIRLVVSAEHKKLTVVPEYDEPIPVVRIIEKV